MSKSKRLLKATQAAGLSALAVAISATGASAAHQAAQPAAKHYTLYIGTSVPLTSGLKPLADGINKAVQLAVAQANARHVLPNVTFQAILLDDTVNGKYSPDKDAANARTLLANQNVIGEVGPLNSAAAQASMPVYNNGGMVQISPANTNPGLTDPANLGKYQPLTAQHRGLRTYFRTAVNDKYQGAAGARFANQVLKVKSVYVVDNKDTYGVGVAQVFEQNARKLGLNVLGHNELEPNQPNMGATAAATVIKNSGVPDLVYFGGEYDPQAGGGVFLIKALKRTGLTRTIFMGPDGCFDPAFITDATPAIANGAYATSVGYPANAKNVSVPAVATQFKTAFAKAFPGVNIAAYDFEAYDAANLIIQATVTAVKKGEFSFVVASRNDLFKRRQAVAKEVAAIRNFHGATGTISFDANGDTTIPPVISVYKVVNGAWQFVNYAPGFGPR